MLEVGGERRLIDPCLVHLHAVGHAGVGAEAVGEAAGLGVSGGLLQLDARGDRTVAVVLIGEVDRAGDDDHDDTSISTSAASAAPTDTSIMAAAALANRADPPLVLRPASTTSV